MVATAVLTTAIAPFVKALLTKASEDTYAAARARLRLFGRGRPGKARSRRTSATHTRATVRGPSVRRPSRGSLVRRRPPGAGRGQRRWNREATSR